YSLMGALRSSAQLVSYETAAGMALVSALLFTGTLNIKSIVEAQNKEGIWFVMLAPVAFFTYLVASIAETNRAPFDLPEAESELVAGYMTEFSGFRWSLFFLAEYANMIVVASVATTLFLGGWLPPFPNTPALHVLYYIPSWTWFLLKSFIFLYIFIWVRATLPRYRYDQLMRLGWKVLIPLAIANLVATGIVKVMFLM